MELKEKLRILSDAAKYDVSCSSSGSNRKNKNGLGNTHESGICHSWSEDGRCISLLKILMTNQCVYNCEYCYNRRDNDIERAEFTPREVAELTVNFYKRNYIEGLFLSSGIVKNPDHTMENLVEVARLLREEYHFYGYIHMKGIPGAARELTEKLGSLVDRMSINIEMPLEQSLSLLAPQKSYESIITPMAQVKENMMAHREEEKLFRETPKFLPAGQTTQMIIGAGAESDQDILYRAESLYDNFSLKRVYYSGFVPVVYSPYTAGIKNVPLLREHRIYQGDFLLRFYGFRAKEILDDHNRNFDLRIDPKANWAINHINLYPIEINRASYEELLRVPGFGKIYAQRIIQARKLSVLTFDDLKLLKISLKRARHFITVNGIYGGYHFTDQVDLKEFMSIGDEDNREQLNFWSME